MTKAKTLYLILQIKISINLINFVYNMINILQWNILDYELAEQDYFVRSSSEDLSWQNRLPMIKKIVG